MSEFAIAAKETLCILDNMEEYEKKRIPQSFIGFLKENADHTYNPNFDNDKEISELTLNKKTKGMLSLIYISYLCDTEEKKIQYKNLLEENSKKYQEEINKKYDVYKIFNDRANKTNIEEQKIDIEPKNMIKYKEEGIIKKIFNKIKNFFNNIRRR